MEPVFWHERWSQNQIGFHLNDVNPLLKQFFSPHFSIAPTFVPLCGKSLDLRYLADLGVKVTGIELSEFALRAFQREQDLHFTPDEVDSVPALINQQYVLYNDDFFRLKSQHVKSIHQVYDRAALIALPEAMRTRYVDHLLQIMPRPLKILLITLEYDQKQMEGPPFSVSEEQVRKLFSTAVTINKLHYNSILESEPHFQTKGLTRLFEVAYLIEIC